LALQQGLLEESALNLALTAQILDALASLLKQTEGEIVAEALPAESLQPSMAGVGDTSALLIEALRRLDEWTRGKVSPDAVLRLYGDPSRHALTSEARALLEQIDGIKRARSIAIESGWPEEQVYHLLYELQSRQILKEAEVQPDDPLILVLSDSSVTRRLLFVTLERNRYRVMLPPDFESTKRILEHTKPQGILLEVSDAAEHVRGLRDLPNARYVPIWVVSQQAPKGIWVKLTRIGHITKSFSEPELLETLAIIKRVV
jgi:CheY-like chemotaxis protein